MSGGWITVIFISSKSGHQGQLSRIVRTDSTTFPAATIELHSDAFGHGEPIPRQYTFAAENLSPPLRWSSPPIRTRSLAMIMDDPDTHLHKPFVHWIVYNILPDDRELPEGIPPLPIVRSMCILQGRNSSLRYGYLGPVPSRHDAGYRYRFQIYALDTVLALQPGVGRSRLLRAISGHVLAKGSLVGTSPK